MRHLRKAGRLPSPYNGSNAAGSPVAQAQTAPSSTLQDAPVLPFQGATGSGQPATSNLQNREHHQAPATFNLQPCHKLMSLRLRQCGLKKKPHLLAPLSLWSEFQNRMILRHPECPAPRLKRPPPEQFALRRVLRRLVLPCPHPRSVCLDHSLGSAASSHGDTISSPATPYNRPAHRERRQMWLLMTTAL